MWLVQWITRRIHEVSDFSNSQFLGKCKNTFANCKNASQIANHEQVIWSLWYLLDSILLNCHQIWCIIQLHWNKTYDIMKMLALQKEYTNYWPFQEYSHKISLKLYLVWFICNYFSTVKFLKLSSQSDIFEAWIKTVCMFFSNWFECFTDFIYQGIF